MSYFSWNRTLSPPPRPPSQHAFILLARQKGTGRRGAPRYSGWDRMLFIIYSFPVAGTHGGSVRNLETFGGWVVGSNLGAAIRSGHLSHIMLNSGGRPCVGCTKKSINDQRGGGFAEASRGREDKSRKGRWSMKTEKKGNPLTLFPLV